MNWRGIHRDSDNGMEPYEGVGGGHVLSFIATKITHAQGSNDDDDDDRHWLAQNA